mgnify:CR=1 FL=1
MIYFWFTFQQTITVYGKTHCLTCMYSLTLMSRQQIYCICVLLFGIFSVSELYVSLCPINKNIKKNVNLTSLLSEVSRCGCHLLETSYICSVKMRKEYIYIYICIYNLTSSFVQSTRYVTWSVARYQPQTNVNKVV